MPRSEKPIRFSATLGKLSETSGWHFLPVSKTVADRFGFTGNSRRVVCTLNGAETFQCGLMPMDGDYFIMVNKSIRQKLGIEPGHIVKVELAKDESKYGLPMPEEFREILDQDPEGDRLFHALTPGKQRNILYYVGKVKDIDKRIHVGLIFVEHLKDNDGKIIHEKLAEELKRPIF